MTAYREVEGAGKDGTAMTGQLLDGARDDRQFVLMWARSWLSTLRVGEPWATTSDRPIPVPCGCLSRRLGRPLRELDRQSDRSAECES
jgi:hypothetical protein